MTKYAAELEVYRGIAEGLDAIMVNPCIVLGPGLPGRSSMTLVERLNRGTRFYPPGANAVVDARDVARCMVALMDRGTSGERYLLVGENLTYQRLFTLLSEAFGRKPPTWPLRSWMLEAAWRLERARSMLTGATPFITEATAHSAITHRTYDPSKVSDLLGYRFLGAAEAITNVAAFLRHRGSA
jgi:nucleoside-diphosphate-sugar epimerase